MEDRDGTEIAMGAFVFFPAANGERRPARFGKVMRFEDNRVFIELFGADAGAELIRVHPMDCWQR